MMVKMRKRGELAVVAVCAVLGFLLALQLKSVKLSSEAADASTAGRLETLQELYNDELDRSSALEDELSRLQNELALYRDEAAQGGEYSEAILAELDSLEILAGLTDVEGPGVTVVMQDSTAVNVTGDEADYLIHDNDIMSVINELRSAGAEAISLNGERILATSEVRCTGAVVTVNGRQYAAPYVIFAIGDANTLYNALTMRNGVVDVLGQWKIEVKVTMSDKLLIPKYSGAVEFRYAAPATEQNAGTDEGVG